jgi:hypothetical protein
MKRDWTDCIGYVRVLCKYVRARTEYQHKVLSAFCTQRKSSSVGIGLLEKIYGTNELWHHLSLIGRAAEHSSAELTFGIRFTRKLLI